jgi:hypothetical protein
VALRLASVVSAVMEDRSDDAKGADGKHPAFGKVDSYTRSRSALADVTAARHIQVFREYIRGCAPDRDHGHRRLPATEVAIPRVATITLSVVSITGPKCLCS